MERPHLSAEAVLRRRRNYFLPELQLSHINLPACVPKALWQAKGASCLRCYVQLPLYLISIILAVLENV